MAVESGAYDVPMTRFAPTPALRSAHRALTWAALSAYSPTRGMHAALVSPNTIAQSQPQLACSEIAGVYRHRYIATATHGLAQHETNIWEFL